MWGFAAAGLLFFASYLIMHGINMFLSLKMADSHFPRREVLINSSVDTSWVSFESHERQGAFLAKLLRIDFHRRLTSSIGWFLF